MKPAGAALILWGAVWLWLRRRRETMEPIRAGRAVLADLAVLRYQVCVLRKTLPQLLEETLADRPWLWRPLLVRLRAAEGAGTSLPECWRQATETLPPPLGRILDPLGPLLGAGGERLAAAIEETREELARFLREETAQQADRGRITAALCLSGALLLILVLV